MRRKNLLMKKNFLKVFTAVVLCWFSVQAAADVVEFQVDSSKIVKLLRWTLKRKEICPLKLNYGGKEYILDLIKFPSGAYARLAPETEAVKISDSITIIAKPVQLVVPIRVGLKTPACMDKPSCGDKHKKFELSLIFSLEFKNGELCAQYQNIGTAYKPFVIPQEIIAKISESICAPLDIDILDELIGNNIAVTGTGVALNSQGRLAVRIKYGSAPLQYPEIPYWTYFYNGNFSPTVPDSDWSLFVSKRLMMKKISGILYEKMQDVDMFKLDGKPGASWIPAENYGQINVDMKGEIRTKWCPNIKAKIGVDVSLHLDDNVLITIGDISLSKSKKGTFLCSLLWGTPVLLLGSTFYGGVSAAITTGIMIFEPDVDVAGGGCESTGNKSFRCESPLEELRLDLEPNTLSSPYGLLRMEYLKGHKDGLIIHGGFQFKNSYAANRQRLSGDGFFEYGLLGGRRCSSLGIGYYGYLSLDGTGYLCDMEIIDDPLGIYRVKKDAANVGLPLTYPLEFIESKNDEAYDKFFENPYPLRVRVYTTAGAETFVVDPPPEKSLFDHIALREILIKAIARCTVMVDRFAGLFWWEWQMRANFQRDGFEEVYKRRLNIGAGMEFRMNHNFCLLLTAGYNRFKDNSGTPMNMLNASVNGKFYLNNRGAVKSFINAGPGYYSFDPGKNNLGFNIGGGLQYKLSNRLVLEVAYNFTNIFQSGKDEQLSSLRTGIRMRF
jgi:hypothetical protein